MRMNELPGLHDAASTLRALDRHHAYQDAAQAAEAAYAEEIAATRPVTAAIRALPESARTAAAFGHICAVLSCEIGKTPWSGVMAAEAAMCGLDCAADDLDAYAQKCSGDIADVVAALRVRGVL